MPCLNYLPRDAIRELYQEIHNFPALLVYHDSYLNDSYLPLVSGTIKYSLSERIKNQKGDFILYYHEDDINKNKKFTIKEVLISPDSINNLKTELELIGISKSTIYPALTEETTKLKIQLESYEL